VRAITSRSEAVEIYRPTLQCRQYLLCISQKTALAYFPRPSQRAQNTGLAYSCSVRSGGQLTRPLTCRRVAFHTNADDLSVRSSRRYLEGCARFERSREWAHPAMSNSTSRFNGIRSGFRRSLAGGERRFVLQLGSSAPSCKVVLRRGERLGPDIA
jgi:hypothetical protein